MLDCWWHETHSTSYGSHSRDDLKIRCAGTIKHLNTTVQSQNAVYAYFTSEKILPLALQSSLDISRFTPYRNGDWRSDFDNDSCRQETLTLCCFIIEPLWRWPNIKTLILTHLTYFAALRCTICVIQIIQLDKEIVFKKQSLFKTQSTLLIINC